MTLTPTVDSAVVVIGLAGAFGGIYSFFRYGSYKATVKLQNDSIAALETNNKILTKAVEDAKKSHLEYVKEIGILEGQVRIYKDLQLEKMATAMEDISKTNQQILVTLQGSNLRANNDDGAGLLVRTENNAVPSTAGGVQ